jgi:hypothetical protein
VVLTEAVEEGGAVVVSGERCSASSWSAASRARAESSARRYTSARRQQAPASAGCAIRCDDRICSTSSATRGSFESARRHRAGRRATAPSCSPASARDTRPHEQCRPIRVVSCSLRRSGAGVDATQPWIARPGRT